MVVLGTLEVHLVGGKDMKKVDVIGKNDPYAIICYKGQKQKSKTISGGGDTVTWNQKFLFEIDDSKTDVVISIYDEDKHSEDDVIGETKVSIANVVNELQKPITTYDLLRPNGHKHGNIDVGLKFTPKEPKGATSRDEKTWTKGTNGPYGNNNEGGWKQFS